MADAPPPIPIEFQIYKFSLKVVSYVIDPVWQRKFTIVWSAFTGACILASLPYLIKSIRNGQAWANVSGILENPRLREYEPVDVAPKEPKLRGARRLLGLKTTVRSFALWCVPHVGLDVGQIVVIVGYFLALLLCISMHAELVDNPNRAGFLALAQLPVVFLLGTKNSILSLLLGPGHGWEKLNYIHRWSGRGMFLAATVHGTLWIRNHMSYGLPILGQQKETTGVACLSLLAAIVITSLKPVRIWAYQFFFVVHVLSFVAFFVTLCYHTLYARPWIFPPLAFYGLDMLMRMFRYRIKDATLIACDKHMTIIHVHDCDDGWIAGQHVRLRVFFNSRILESHPLTIMSAPPQTTCLSTRTLTLGARVNGDWTTALNAYALSASPDLDITNDNADEGSKEESAKEPKISVEANEAGIETEKPTAREWRTAPGASTGMPVQVQVMIDGPYGGSSVDLGSYERVLLVAGGSGATFTIGLLDDIVGRCVKLGRRREERTRKIEFVWCVRSYGSLDWFGPQLTDIASTAARDPSLSVHMTIFVTCQCRTVNAPAIPNCDVITDAERPSSYALLQSLLSATPPNKSSDLEDGEAPKINRSSSGGVAVCAAGPGSLTREARNAVARVSLVQGLRIGDIACHTEEYSI